MQVPVIETDPDGYERTAHGTAAFPIRGYDNNLWLYPTHGVPWHWHEECELMYVSEGTAVLRATETKFTLEQGQGAFVNSNELHSMDPANEGPCRMDCTLFDPSIIGGAPYSLFQLKYVAPIYKNPRIRAVIFTEEVPWQAELLESLRRTRPTFDSEAFGHELEVRTLLSTIWLKMLENLDTQAPRIESSMDPHIRTMMLYIHRHYAEPLTLGDIAASADVSVRTCSRSFKKQLGMSVFSYLMSHRVKQAAQLLATTQDSITDICFATGFSDTGYFARVFRSVTGQTPRAFRKDAIREQKDPTGPIGQRIGEEEKSGAEP